MWKPSLGNFTFNMENLENAKVGDLLLIYGGDTDRLATVKRTTSTRVITNNDTAFRKKDGCEVGQANIWWKKHARLATESDIKRFKRESWIGKCRNINFNNLTDSQLQEILNIAYPKKEN